MSHGGAWIAKKTLHVSFVQNALKRETMKGIVFNLKEMLGVAAIVEILRLGMKTTFVLITKDNTILTRNKFLNKCQPQLKILQFLCSILYALN